MKSATASLSSGNSTSSLNNPMAVSKVPALSNASSKRFIRLVSPLNSSRVKRNESFKLKPWRRLVLALAQLNPRGGRVGGTGTGSAVADAGSRCFPASSSRCSSWSICLSNRSTHDFSVCSSIRMSSNHSFIRTSCYLRKCRNK